MEINNKPFSFIDYRTRLFWKNKEGKFVCIKNHDIKMLFTAKEIIENLSTDNNRLWYGFSKDVWLSTLKEEISFRNNIVDLIIKSNLDYKPPLKRIKNLLPIGFMNEDVNINKTLRSLLV